MAANADVAPIAQAVSHGDDVLRRNSTTPSESCDAAADVIGSSIAASSAPEAGRRHGSLDGQRKMIRSSRGSISGFKIGGLSGRFVRCIAATSMGEGATKGSMPVAKRYMM